MAVSDPLQLNQPLPPAVIDENRQPLTTSSSSTVCPDTTHPVSPVPPPPLMAGTISMAALAMQPEPTPIIKTEPDVVPEKPRFLFYFTVYQNL